MEVEKCSICRDPMDGGAERQDWTLQCNHRFHTECIIDSLRMNKECPVCRDSGNEEDKESLNNEIVQIHLNTDCTCVGCSMKEYSDNYGTFLVTEQILKNNYKQKLDDFKKVAKEHHFFRDKLMKKYSVEKREFEKKLYNSLANSNEYKEFNESLKECKRSKALLKNKILSEFKNMGYEKKIFDEFVDGYRSIESKFWRHNNNSFYLDKLLKNIANNKTV